MKRFLNKFGLILLALSLLLFCVPATAEAMRISGFRPGVRVTETVVIPGAMEADQTPIVVDIQEEPQMFMPSGQQEYLKDVNAAGAVLREAMKQRADAVTIYVEADASVAFSDLAGQILEAALAHTGEPTEGDYLRWQRGPVVFGGSYYPMGDTYQYTIEFNPTYYTTAQQEAQMDDAVEELLANLELDGMTDYETLCAIYEWMCANITYDYDHLDDESYMLQYTAYAALMERSSVCQGYAVLLYRLLLEEGIDNRVVNGIGNGGPHAWNIVQMDGVYHNVDATWDAIWYQAGLPYNFFLRTDANFEDHARDAKYETEEFLSQYAIALDGGACGAQLSWAWVPGNKLVIYGQGEMWDYSTADVPWKAYLDQITAIEVKDQVTSISASAFRGISNLEEMKLPFVGGSQQGKMFLGYLFGASSYFENGEYVPESLKTLIVSNACTYIYNGALYGCAGLESLTLPFVGGSASNNTYLAYIFGAQSEWNSSSSYVPESLKTVVISEGCTSIGMNAFYYCDQLTNIVLPKTLTSIGRNAVYGCTGLTNIVLPDGLTEIGEYAFYGCTGLTNMVIPGTVTELGSNIFSDCTGLTSVVFAEGCTSTGDYMFWDCSALTQVTLPQSMTELGNSVFRDCSALNNVILPDGLITIGYGAFEYCSGLTQITIPDSVTTINDSAFLNCTGLTKLVVPDSVTHIGGSAFSGCDSVEELTLPFVGESATSNQHLSYIAGGLGASEESKLKKVILSEACTSIPDYAFMGCKTLTTVVIPDTVTSIGVCAFSGCEMLTSIAIPASVTSMGAEAFNYCDALKHVYITDLEAWCNIEFASYSSNPIHNDGSLYVNGELVTDLVIPDTVTEIGKFAFYSCSSIMSVTIPDSVISIGERAFYQCPGLGTLTLGEKVAEIGANAFNYCEGLWKIVNNSQLEIFHGDLEYGRVGYYAMMIISGDQWPYEDDSWHETEDGFVYVLDHGYYTLRAYIGDQETVRLPANIDGNYYEIAEFRGARHVIIPGHISEIGYDAFSNSVDLISVTMETGVTSIQNYAFFGCVNLQTVTIPEGVTTIGDYAFSECTSLVTVTIPKGVTSIGWAAFENCSALVSIALPDSVTSIGVWAFRNCVSLTEINIPDGVTTIKGLCFQNCVSLENVKLPAGLSSIEQKAFEGCSSLTQVTIPEGTIYIGEYAFNNCSSLRSVVIPSSVKIIDSGAFSGPSVMEEVYITDLAAWLNITFDGGGGNPLSGTANKKLYLNGELVTELVIPAGITTIGNRAFINCSSITSVIIADGVTTIGSEAFRNCTGLTSVTIPASLTSICHDAFTGCDAIEAVHVADLAAWCAVDFGWDNRIFANGASLYVNDQLVTELVIPDGVTTIEYAFKNCGSITSVVIPGSVTRIGARAFSGCSNLASVTIADGVTSIGEHAFSLCYNLTSITIPGSVDTIEDNAFASCDALSSVTIGEGVKTIGSEVFAGCKGLTSLVIPDSVTSIGRKALSGCNALETLVLPFVGDGTEENTALCYLFTGYTYGAPDSLKTVILTESCTVIGQYAFSECRGLTNVVIPNTVTSIGDYAFDNCHNLPSIVIPESVTSIGAYAFSTCLRLSEINLPDSVTTIGENAFTYCSSLTSIRIPSSVTSIPARMFSSCSSLRVVLMPDTITSIGENAFESCMALWHVMYNGTQEQWDAIIIENQTSDWYEATVHVNSTGEEIVDVMKLQCDLCMSDCTHDFMLSEFQDATCTEAGYCEYACYQCSYRYTEEIKATGHHWQEATCQAPKTCAVCHVTEGDLGGHKEVTDPAVAATCTQSGLTEGKHCALCGQILVEQTVIPATGHNYQAVVTAPTCTAMGYTTHTCGNCGDSYVDSYTDALDHDLSPWTQTKAPTCTEQGEEVRTCSRCDYVLKQAVAEKGHDYIAAVTGPTCTEQGYTTHTCSGCGDSYKDDYTDMIGHTYQAVVTEPSCTKDGYTTFTCQLCGDSYVDYYVYAHGHNYVDVVTPPTCTQQGYTTSTCSYCGDSYTYGVTDRMEHEMSQWIEIELATCTETGTEWRKCQNCNLEEFRATDAKGHLYLDEVTAPTCTKEGYTTHTCYACGDSYTDCYVPMIAHQYSCTETLPTCEENGSRYYACLYCDDHYTEELPATGHLYTYLENQKYATCSEAGYSGDWVCYTCCKIVEYGYEIAATGMHNYSVTFTSPTCETAGGWTYTCQTCGSSYEEVLPANGHSTYLYNVQDATCGTDGYTGDEVCYVCGKIVVYGEVISATGNHSYQSQVTVEATCTASGVKTHTCWVCHDSYAEEIPALGHSYCLINDLRPTCGTDGYTGDEVCARCGDVAKMGERIPATEEHAYASYRVAEPSCTEEGIIVHSCQTCGHSYEERIAAYGHSFELSTLEPTCTEAGWIRYTCSTCGYMIEDMIEPTGHDYEVRVIEATCTHEGYTVHKCRVCGDHYTSDYTPMIDHDYTAIVIYEPPTCTQDGAYTYTCSCGDSYQEIIPATGHQNVVIINAVEATCGTDGYTGDTYCNDCYSYVEYGSTIPATGQHSYETVVTAPTCTEVGYTTYTCHCGDTYVAEEVAALGHSYEMVETAPTCTVDGSKVYTCHCGYSYTDVIPATGHSYVLVETVPTCTEDGGKVYTCHCGDIYTEVLPATGHKYSAVVTAPTCIEKGYTTYTCHCGDSYVADEVAALGHSYVVTETAPTCTEDGSKVYTCHCGDTYTEVVPAIGHAYSSVVTEPTCTEKGYTTHTCTNCGATYTSDHVDALGHSYEAVVTAPTCTEGGYTTYTCHCGDSYVSDHTEATGHSWDEGVITKEPTTEAEGEKTYTCQHCGATKTEVLPKKEPVIYDVPEDNTVTIPENDCFEGGTTVTVEEIVDGELLEQVTEVMEDVAESYVAYAFTATKDEVAVQPNGKLTVTFQIPEGYSTNVAVYYMAEDGKLEELVAVVDAINRTVTVELEHFSTYIVADEDTAPAYILGDVNGDGRINVRDVRLLMRYIAGLAEESELIMSVADYNNDGKINVRDVRLLMRVIAGLD